MLDRAKIVEIAKDVARSNLVPRIVSDVIAEPAIDSEGHDALRITIIIEAGSATQLKGDAVLDTLVQMQDRLREAGEERFPIVEYATEDELANGGDPRL